MSSRPHPESERPLHGPLQRFDLGAEIDRLREERAWQRGQRNSITLRKGEGMNVVLLLMKAGDRLEEHAAPDPLKPERPGGTHPFHGGRGSGRGRTRYAARLRRRDKAHGGGLERCGVPSHHRKLDER